MAIEPATVTQLRRKQFFSVSRRRLALRIFATAVMVIYTIVTIFPFYALFVRSFVATKDASDLHLWLPEAREVPMEAEVGNLSVFYQLDLRDFKRAIGIPENEFLMSRMTLKEVAEQYNIPQEEIREFFEGFYTYNGWMTLLKEELQGTTFWAALLRTVLITGISLALLTVLSICTGYGLAGLRRKDQMAVYNVYLLQMVIPIMLIILPQYQLFQYVFGLVPDYARQGSFVRSALQLLAMILINIKGTALTTMIFVGTIGTIPKDLEDSAMMDGASRLQYVRHVLLPLLKVPIVSMVVIQLPLFYNQFLEPYVYLDPSNSTLLPFIQSTSGQFSTNFQVIYAGVFASVVPLIVIYLIFRRFFVEGVMAGAIKG